MLKQVWVDQSQCSALEHTKEEVLDSQGEFGEPALGQAGVWAAALLLGLTAARLCLLFFSGSCSGVAAAEVLFHAAPARAWFFFAKLELNSCPTCPSVF